MATTERSFFQTDVRTESQYSDTAPQDTPFIPPQTTFVPGHSLASTPRASTYGTPDVTENQVPLLSSNEVLNRSPPTDPYDPYAPKELNSPEFDSTDVTRPYPIPGRPWYRRPVFWLAGTAGVIAVVLAVILPVYFTVIKPNKHSGNSNSDTASGTPSSSSPTTPNPGSPTGAITGGNGSVIVLADGSNFTYINEFGGYCKCVYF